MGLLTIGTPLSWEETKKKAEEIKEHGIKQFINLYEKFKNKRYENLTWGYEVEYTFIYLDHKNKSARLQLKCNEVLPTLNQDGGNLNNWRMEYANYMIESVPDKPFQGNLSEFNLVEESMEKRRKQLLEVLGGPQETIICFSAFPRIGCPLFTEPMINITSELNSASRSLFFPDAAIYPDHPRFITLTRNIPARRKKKQAINLPIYRDKNTADPYIPPIPESRDQSAIKPNHVYMDCMGFGMGCCCLQLTIQTCDIFEARFLYDQLAVVAPIMLALSAASPAYQGILTDIDCRWDVISGSVDDRTSEELGETHLANDKFHIKKSRFDCIDMYLSESSQKYNNVQVQFDENHKQMLVDTGIDEVLSKHIAHLFIRDPISLFSENIDLDDKVDIDHFLNIQSTNWQTLRFKPPINESEGWRVEFRPMEVQLTDFENSAYVVFVVLLTRIILSFNINLIIPISNVEENMKNATKRNAVNEQQFHFRNFFLIGEESENVELMSIDKIINGEENGFPGLIPLIRCYLISMCVDVETCCTINRYLTLISKRASGTCKTMASWIRSFVKNHPSYKHDSHISENINYDLSVLCDKISRGETTCTDFLGPSYITGLDVSKTLNDRIHCVTADSCKLESDRGIINSLKKSLNIEAIKVSS